MRLRHVGDRSEGGPLLSLVAASREITFTQTQYWTEHIGGC
jgi:hypothetical protein